jgi:hypothetical protein
VAGGGEFKCSRLATMDLSARLARNERGNFFADDHEHRLPRPGLNEWSAATLNVVIGGTIVWNAHRLFASRSTILIGWIGMVGIVLTLHFGLLHLLSCLWRNFGLEAPPLMNEPIRSTSIAEFWGKRWNTAFRDLMYQFIFRPLQKHCGARAALVVGFIFSGAVHELVISLPAGGGYGRPTCFFSIQAAAILFERSSFGKPFHLGRGWCGWLFTALVLLLPVRLLFHHHFVKDIVVPFMTALSAA